MSPRIGLDLQTLLQVATEIADQKGMEAVTLASLAQKLEIKSPSLYNHVNGLKGLRKKMAIYGLEQLHQSLIHAAIGLSGDDAIRAMGRRYVTFVRSHPGLYEATLQAPDQNDPEVQQAGKLLVDLVLQVLKPFGLKEDESLHITRGLRSLLHGFASLEQKGGFGLPLNRDESLDLLMETYLAGIHTRMSIENKD